MKTLFLLNILLLFQSITASPLAGDKLTERENLEVIAIEEAGKDANKTVHKYQGIFEATVKEIEGKPPVSESIQQKLQEFKDFNNRVDSLSENIDEKFLDEVFDLLTRVHRILSIYSPSNLKANDEHLINEKLVNNGFDTAQLNSMRESDVFKQNARKRYTEWKSLPEAERELNPKVVEWYKNLKATGEKNQKLLWILDGVRS